MYAPNRKSTARLLILLAIVLFLSSLACSISGGGGGQPDATQVWETQMVTAGYNPHLPSPTPAATQPPDANLPAIQTAAAAAVRTAQARASATARP